MVLSKDELLNGAKKTIEFEIKSLGDSIYLRPLTIGEINNIEEHKSKALGTYTADEIATSKKARSKIKAQAKINIEKTTIADNKASIKAVFFSINNDDNPFTFTEEEILKMDSLVFEEILSKVKEISHWDNEDLEDDVEDFHQDG